MTSTIPAPELVQPAGAPSTPQLRPDDAMAAPLPDRPARRVVVHVVGLLLLGCYWSLARGVMAVGAMYGVQWSAQDVLRIGLGQVGASMVLFFWLMWMVIARTGLSPRVSNRSRLLQRSAAAACGIAAMYSAIPTSSTLARFAGQMIFACVLVWLTVEVTRAHGVSLGGKLPATPAQRLRDWKIGWMAFVVCVVSGAAAALMDSLIRWAGIEGIPVMQGDQLSVLGIDSPGKFALALVRTVAIEDVVVVAATTALLTAARRPAWEVYTLASVIEVLMHAYTGLPAIMAVLFAVGRVWLYRRYRSLLPLMAAHAVFDVKGGDLPLLDLDYVYRLVLVLLVWAVFIWISHRLMTAAATEAHSPPTSWLRPRQPRFLDLEKACLSRPTRRTYPSPRRRLDPRHLRPHEPLVRSRPSQAFGRRCEVARARLNTQPGRTGL
ncbi:CPBP family intramembrane glutamic endopeptidase [Streptomyces sp. GQFP]|uniref:CPBP family intramembrane glutamic endopeptidase n=1 Tax=Streptomyces sp. GQFP TaxID=2907545 RepID=UPI001F37B550|nr:CPBP family intramembrane glutamic endopeptidase [Streptomyces sp. GQFP]UIX34273.1 CPBP family intramembrane metalloprotease [Streptomyces sp. GQFP]